MKKKTLKEAIEDFWSKTPVGDDKDCWEWSGGRHGKPPHHHYGVISYSGKKVKAHRFSYEIHFGKIKRGLEVCHKCDNPPCVNPKHLFLGTRADNVRDMDSKGRRFIERGEDRYNATLTNDDIRQIRSRYTFRDPVNGGRALAKEFGVGFTMISAIVNRLRWKHVQ